MKKFVLQPHHLGWLSGILWIGVFALLYPWLSSVFRGDSILNQDLIRLNLNNITIFGAPIPFSDFSIRFYSVFMLLAFAAGYVLTLFLVRRTLLPETLVDRLLIGIVLFGLLGARAFYVLFNIPVFFGNVTDVGSFFAALGRTFLIYEGGLAISGGIIGVVLYLIWYTRTHKFSLLEVTDLLAPGLLLGQIIGRWGNFFNYEAYGGPTSVYWKMYVPENAINANKYLYAEDLAQFFHPTFLYEMIPNIILLSYILIRFKSLTARSAGLITAVYLIGYGLIRTFTEFFRLDALKIPFELALNVPKSIASALGNVLPSGIREPFVYWLENFGINGILVSQIVALGMVVIGIYLYRKRSGVIYSPARATDVTA